MGHRESASKYALNESRQKRDIGDIPEVMDVGMRERVEDSLESFCLECQPEIFSFPFASIHIEVIKCLETAINSGGLFAYAMPRGVGKTCLAEAACVWAILTGKRRYVVLISATEKHATQSLDNIKKEMSTNERILDGWPEIVWPVHCLEGIAHRAAGQIHNGEKTHIVWKGEQLVIPTIPGSIASGSVIEVRGLTGAIRGMKANLPGGKGSIRPELVVLDDPQTDESSKSPSQCRDRERIIQGTVLGLAGHKQEISAVMPCTVIHKGDLAEQFLNNENHPEWHGVRTKLMISMPKNMPLWERYKDLTRTANGEAKKFYLANRTLMDEGAVPVWEHCFNVNQVSAIQHAMDLKFSVGDVSFASEYQNDPLEEVADVDIATADDIYGKVTKYNRYDIPVGCSHLLAYIDVHKSLLFYAVCGFTESFNGYVVDYGTWPATNRQFFSLRDIRKTLQDESPGMGLDGSIYAGLQSITDKLLNRTWGDDKIRIEKCIVDANWKTTIVKTFCRESTHALAVMPGHGRYIGANRKPLNEYLKSAGDRQGLGWRIPHALSREGIRHIIYDINYWKSFLNTAWMTPPGERGCLQLYGGREHKLFAEHMTSEYPNLIEGRGRVVQEWSLHTGRENHWLDCMVGCAMAASLQGCKLIDHPVHRPRKRTTVSYIDG